MKPIKLSKNFLDLIVGKTAYPKNRAEPFVIKWVALRDNLVICCEDNGQWFTEDEVDVFLDEPTTRKSIRPRELYQEYHECFLLPSKLELFLAEGNEEDLTPLEIKEVTAWVTRQKALHDMFIFVEMDMQSFYTTSNAINQTAGDCSYCAFQIKEKPSTQTVNRYSTNY